MKCKHCHKDAPCSSVCEDCKMTEKQEFNLSKKIHNTITAKEDNSYFDEGTAFVLVKDVKEFIKRLKEVVIWKCGKNTDNALFWDEQIDALAGKELLE